MLPARHFFQYFGEQTPSPPDWACKSAVLSEQSFAQARNLLGQELDWILFDARQAFNLEALAMAAGTLRAGGSLILWLNPQPHIDADSQRWSGVAQGIATPNFDRHLQQLLVIYAQPFDCTAGAPMPCAAPNLSLSRQANTEQAVIIQQILHQPAELSIITAKRGRGKSALAGLLAAQLQQRNQRVLLTAPNKSAVQILQDFAQSPIEFIAPDQLLQQLEQQPDNFAQHWLLIDEAAMLPLAWLNRLVRGFKRVVLSTTVQSYEGTGRGFLLKFLANLHRSYRHFELHQPLRWRQDDPLERFIEQLLLLDCETRLIQPPFCAQNGKSAVQFGANSQQQIVARIEQFYGLLSLAHYRTSPLDLRRLLDAPEQKFYLAELQNQLLAGVWAVQEGAMQDEDLIAQICRGERRVRGHLAAQSLAFYGDFAQACRLKSLRISRIAVQPNWQNQGIGQQLIAQLKQREKVDFLSVSFGYQPELARFWQKCGFILVQISEQAEASSGAYSALMLYPLSAQGQDLLNQAQHYFQRNFAFAWHELAAEFDYAKQWQLEPKDWQILQNFADFHRTLAASIGSIQRLLAQVDKNCCPLLVKYCESNQIDKQNLGGKKAWLAQCRLEIQQLLKEKEHAR